MGLKRFNVYSEQRKLNRRHSYRENIKIRTIVLSIFVLVGSIMLFTYSKFSKTIKLDVMHAKVSNFLQDDYIVNAYVDGNESSFPDKNDGYYVDEVVCNKGAIGTWDENEWGLLITDATEEETECNVYFKTLYSVYEFEFDPDNDGNGQVQTFTVPLDGIYKLEVWGAQGGNAYNQHGGYGGYSVGVAELTKNTNYSVVVGGQGVSLNDHSLNSDGGYNGGGIAQTHCDAEHVDNDSAGAGGGATHIAIENNNYSILSSYGNENTARNYVLIVAGGGGGGERNNDDNHGTGGSGGGIQGESPTDYVASTALVYANRMSYPGTQSSAGCSSGSETSLCGGFGYGGGTVKGISSDGCYRPTAGGGAGWYGGGGTWYNGGSGGSGYIASDNLLTSNGITKHMACYNCTTSNTASTKTETKTCHDDDPTPDCSKEGNGYARITFVSRG